MSYKYGSLFIKAIQLQLLTIYHSKFIQNWHWHSNVKIICHKNLTAVIVCHSSTIRHVIYRCAGTYSLVSCEGPAEGSSQSLTVRFPWGSSSSVSGGLSMPGSCICVSAASEGCRKWETDGLVTIFKLKMVKWIVKVKLEGNEKGQYKIRLRKYVLSKNNACFSWYR